jgi:hypothetical protein
LVSWILPSARDVFFLLLFWSLLGGALSNRPLADADLGWHIRAGEQILATHSVPYADPFSSTMQGQPWIAWEWLYDVVLALLHHVAGLNGVVWLCAGIISLTMTILFAQLVRRGTGLPLAFLLSLLALGAAAIHLYARPHIVSWLLMLTWFIGLERWERDSRIGKVPRWLPWLFPLSMVAWVNLHGGWLLGLTLMSIYLVAAWVESWHGSDEFARIVAARHTVLLGRTFVITILATLVNPYGIRLQAHIYRYLGNRYLMNRIQEFHSPDFHGWAERSFALIFVLTLIALVGNRSNFPLRHVLVAFLATYSGFIAARNLPVSGMLLVLIAGPVLWENVRSLAERAGAWEPFRKGVESICSFSDRVGAQEMRFRGHLWAVAGVILAFLVAMHGGRVGRRPVLHAGFDAQRFPIAASEFLAHEPNDNPILAPDIWGGYLIYRLYPARRVMIDDRHDLYGSDRFRDYLVLMQGEPGWRKVLDNWRVETILLPDDSTAANLLRELPDTWRTVYEDRVAVVMERRQTLELRTTSFKVSKFQCFHDRHMNLETLKP